jgi:twitching motility protein PilT
VKLEGLLTEALDRGASDIHVLAGRSPVFRINTELIDSGFPTVSEEMAVELVREMVGTRRYAQFLRRRDLDFST